MINILLFILGVICIITAFILFFKESNSEEAYYKELLNKYNELRDYNKNIEEVVENIEDIIESIDKKVVLNGKSNANAKNEKNFKDVYDEVVYKLSKTENNKLRINDIKDEIFRLRDNGLDSSEIAKRLGRGKREIDIILKMKDDISV